MSETSLSAEPDAASKWWVQVRGQAYGPYTMSQLSEFAAEGRIRPATQVSKRPDGGWSEARRVIGLTASSAAAQPANDSADAANVIVHAEIFSGSWHAFNAALASLGHFCELAPGLWLLRTRHSAGVIRNMLSQTLEHRDRFVVVDSSRDRLAWFNLGPELDVRIGRVWNSPLRGEQG